MDRRAPLEEYLAASYPFFVTPDPDGGYVVTFPDLPGCVTKVASFAEIGPRAEELRTLWLRTVYSDEVAIPLPPSPEEYSGRFNLRLPRSLHQWLVNSAAAEGISLNQYVAMLLARGDSQARVERRLDGIDREASGGKETAMPITEANKAIVRRFYEEIWNEGRLEVADQILPTGEEREDFKRHVKRSRSQTQCQHTVEDLIAEGDKVVAVVSVRGHQTKLTLPLVGHLGASTRFEQTEVVIFRLAEARIVERSRHLGPAQPALASQATFKFTDRARRVLTRAQEEAQGFRHNYIGTEHLLLGLIRVEDGVAAKVLQNRGVELENVRTAVEHIIGRGDEVITGPLGLTPRSKKVIERAVQEAKRLNHHYIGTEHLLLGVVQEGSGIAAGILKSLGIEDVDRVRSEVLRILNSPPPKV